MNACRWATLAVPHAPYVTTLPWISHYGCKYVVHGDDITSDSNGEDCYRFVKAAGRFKIVKRTPGISTTDLVGRMLLCTRTHFIKDLDAVLEGHEGHGSDEERKSTGTEMKERIAEYASDESGNAPLVEVWTWLPKHPGRERRRSSTSSHSPVHHRSTEKGIFAKKVEGQQPQPGQKVIYVDGGFDLFSSGHIEFLRKVVEAEESEAKKSGWDKGYSPVFVVAGVHDDEVINHWKGINYPIMNIFERGLCVLQCKVKTKLQISVIRAAYLTHHSVYLGDGFLRPFHAQQAFLELVPIQRQRRLARPDNIHSARRTRPILGCQVDGTFPGGFSPRLLARQRDRDCGSHLEEQGHVRGEAAYQGSEGYWRGGSKEKRGHGARKRRKGEEVQRG